MFHSYTFTNYDAGSKLQTTRTFIKSNYIKVFPCGRRRSTYIDLVEPSSSLTKEKQYIPFDPEARLNTEANNRKHSGLNGFKQNYLLEWKDGTDEQDGKLVFVISGYVFEITLPKDKVRTLDDFVNALIASKEAASGETDVENTNTISANIRLDNISFFSSTTTALEAKTEVLRNQTQTAYVSDCFDEFIEDSQTTKADTTDRANYFFSGLSFTDTGVLSDGFISMVLFVKRDGLWQISNTARLPKIDHGQADNSIKVGSVEADSIKIGDSIANFIPLIEVVQRGNTDNPTFQLSITTKAKSS